MATVNEQIVTGRKFRKLIDEATKLWQRISFWTKASDVEFDDGQTAENKMGAIKGITSDINVTVPGYAADMTTVSELYSNIDNLEKSVKSLNSNLSGETYTNAWMPCFKIFGGGMMVIIPKFKKEQQIYIPYVRVYNSSWMVCSVEKCIDVGSFFMVYISGNFDAYESGNAYLCEMTYGLS